MTVLGRRAFLRGAAVLAGTTLLEACAGPDRGAGSLRPSGTNPGPTALSGPSVRIAGGALGFPSPFAYQAGIGYYQMSFLYDTLLWRDGSGQLLGWLAESCQASPDARTYRFVLRPGLYWHDGIPLTAEDVVFTFQYFTSNPLGPLVVAQPQAVARVRAIGATGVEIQLRQADVTFAENQAGAIPIVPKHIWSKIKDPASVENLGRLVGSGPYLLGKYGGNGGPLLYEANDRYFLGHPFVRRIEELPVGDALTSLAEGDVDVAETDVAGARPEVLVPFSDGWAGAQVMIGEIYRGAGPSTPGAYGAVEPVL